MPYVGNKPEVGNFRKCDAITTSATATYNLLVGGVAVNPNQNQCIVSLNGVIQSSGNSYTIASSQITFASALTSSDVIDFILILGDTLNAGIPSDSSVDASKITANIITGQTALGATPADTDELMISDSGTLKRVDYSYLKSSVVNRPNAQPIWINGSMAVAQRATSATGKTAGGFYTVDRMQLDISGTIGTWTVAQESQTSGNAIDNGFANAYRIDCTSATASPASGAFLKVISSFEGQDLQMFKKGTSNAQKFTLAFWVKSNKTGTAQVNLRDMDNTRMIGASYSISSADTWEFKVCNFAADTTGKFDDDNARSLIVEWWLDGGSDYTSGAMPTAWEARNAADSMAAGSLDMAGSTDNDFAITGIQLEVGEYTSATLPPFQHESFGDNLQRCMRYCVVIKSPSGTSTELAVNKANPNNYDQSRGCYYLTTPLRSGATSTLSGTVKAGYIGGSYTLSDQGFSTTSNTYGATTDRINVVSTYMNQSSNNSQHSMTYVLMDNSSWTLDAEL